MMNTLDERRSKALEISAVQSLRPNKQADYFDGVGPNIDTEEHSLGVHMDPRITQMRRSMYPTASSAQANKNVAKFAFNEAKTPKV